MQSLIYIGNGQYGLARGAEYYFGRPLATFTAEDADKAALLAGTVKSARYYAPTASQPQRVLQRRNQILALMAASGFISPDRARGARQRPIETVTQHKDKPTWASAIVENVLEELTGRRAETGGRQSYKGRSSAYSDFNRVKQSLRQLGSAMQPIVYLAAFRKGTAQILRLGAGEFLLTARWLSGLIL